MKEITDNDIKKALEICMEVDTPRDCEGCCFKIFKDKCGCELSEASLRLINRLQTKNKELDEKNILYRGMIDKNCKAIERLKTKLFLALHTDTAKRNIESEAIKRFEDKVIKRICERVVAPTPSQSYIVERCNEVIHDLVKEMEG